MSSNTMSISRMVLSTWASKAVARFIALLRAACTVSVRSCLISSSTNAHIGPSVSTSTRAARSPALRFKLHPVASYAKFLFSKLTDER